MHESPSEHSKKRYGEIGSPWRIPRVGLKLSEKTPLTLTEKETEETQFMTKEHHDSGKPKATMIAFR
jgi:hypothetical protein